MKDAFDDIEEVEEEEEEEVEEEEESGGGAEEEEAGRGAEESDFLFTSRGDACTGELEAQPILTDRITRVFQTLSRTSSVYVERALFDERGCVA